MRSRIFRGLFGFFLAAAVVKADAAIQETEFESTPYILVLGIAQDGGFPQAGCRRACCRRARENPDRQRAVVCLALVDPGSRQRWLFECTPDFRQQLELLDHVSPPEAGPGVSGIFLTHAHIGHYAGLMHLGREVLGADHVPTYAMPRMKAFLTTNGPWSQLVGLGNIELKPLAADRTESLNERIQVTPLIVPHRDEFSETVAFRIAGPRRSVLFLPDIDKWDRWERKIEEQLSTVDVAYLDATFYDETELPGRDLREIPHPFVVETIERFAGLPAGARSKVRLIHLNHTNPLLDPDSAAQRQVKAAGLGVAEQGERVDL
jgi:pyrroloquinoline quinone biosynthesis protein B